ncbi:RNA ligase [Mesorhizobium amorphae]|uniref:RNA ligase n=1 Tax=Mesorhizobium amorphae TaxID=71433 RepID=UPI003ECEA5AE
MFPVIETVDDVLPHIQGNIGFFLTRFDDYDVIDYGFVGDDTFRSPMALECRGLKFAKDGRLIARPFHKFFNLGERQRPEDIDWTVPHVVLSKLDGSMVHPCVVRDELVFMTRMGVTAQSTAALAHAGENIRRLSKCAVEAGTTVLFEFTSPENRVVIAYDQPSLTLLAARDNRTGRYSTHQELQSLADQFDVPLIPSLQMTISTRDFLTIARSEEGIEGYVIVFDDGQRFKLKTAFYALRHKALSGLAYEKNILAWVAEGAVDDVVPLLAADFAAELKAYQSVVVSGLNRHLGDLAAFVAGQSGRERKEFAAAFSSNLDKRLQGAAFAMYDGKDGSEVLRKQLLWASYGESRLESIRDLYGMSWKCPAVTMEVG